MPTGLVFSDSDLKSRLLILTLMKCGEYLFVISALTPVNLCNVSCTGARVLLRFWLFLMVQVKLLCVYLFVLANEIRRRAVVLRHTFLMEPKQIHFSVSSRMLSRTLHGLGLKVILVYHIRERGLPHSEVFSSEKCYLFSLIFSHDIFFSSCQLPSR